MKVYQLVGEIQDFDYVSETFGFRICGPASLKRFLAGCADGETVEIEINSPGGLCVPGLEMANAIKNSKAHVIAHVTGMAASMASVIACACDEVKMEEAAFLMIHDPWSYAEGSAAAMRREAQNLDQFKAVIMSFYRGKFNRTPEEISALMSEETWMTGSECVENGFKCELVKSDLKMAALVGCANFAKMPEAAAALYQFKELTDDAKAEIEKARAAQHPDSSPSAATEDGNWEARYKGASKKINDLQAKLEKAEADAQSAKATIADLQAKLEKAEADLSSAQSAKTELADLQAKLEKTEADLSSAQSAKTELDAAKATINDLNGKLETADAALADANASVSKLTGELDQVKKDLVLANERADHLKTVNATITGGVLIPSEDGGSYDSKMDRAIKSGTVNDRMALRKQKSSGKIK